VVARIFSIIEENRIDGPATCTVAGASIKAHCELQAMHLYAGSRVFCYRLPLRMSIWGVAAHYLMNFGEYVHGCGTLIALACSLDRHFSPLHHRPDT
jgi:hypothetical protein